MCEHISLSLPDLEQHMKHVLPWQIGRNRVGNLNQADSKKHSRKLASAVRACFEELELRRMLSVSANPNGPYTVNEGSSIQIGGSASGAAGYSYKWDLNYNGVTFHTQATGQGFTYKAADGPLSRTIALKVINANDATDFDLETTTLTINNVAPTITLTGAGSASAGDVYTLNFSATDPGQDTISGWDIDWGDGSNHTTPAGNATSATHVFGTAGATTITVSATDEDGTYQQTKNVTISAVTPTVTLTGDSSVNEGSAYTLNFSSTNSNIRNGWTIDWGDGETDFDDTSVSSDTHTYADNGSYTITVGAITDDTEGDGTLNLTVNNVAPTVAITSAPTSSPEGTAITLGSTESDPGVNDTETYAWSVTKDGNAYSLPNNVTTNGTGLTFTPRHAGSYVVNLTVTDNDGGATTVHTSAINVTKVTPTANITGAPNGAIHEGDTVSLTMNPSDAGVDETFSYAWSVTQDNNFYTLPVNVPVNQANFSFAPDDNGSFVVTCVATDDSGAAVTVHLAAITVNNVAPTATISGAPQNDINEGDTVQLTANANDAGTADLDSLTYAWSVKKGNNSFTLPNGTATNLPAFSFVPTDNGTYVAKVVVTDKDGGTVSVNSSTITVDNVAPTGTITGAPTTSPEGTSITLTAHGSDVGVLDTLTYSWAVKKDGNSFTLPNNTVTNAPAFTFVPTDNGSYVATVTITDNDGGSTPVSTSAITVTNVAPTVAITGTPTTSPEGTQITFGSTVTDPGTLDTETYGWTVYKDGNHYTLPNNTNITSSTFSFTPTDNGSYVVRLTVIDKDNDSTTVNSDAITVTNVAPTATVGGEPNGHINEGDEVDLTANVTDPGSDDTFTYSWSVLKDGETYNLGNIDTTSSTFSFDPNDNGSYVATVVVTDKDGGIGGSSSTAIIADNVNPNGTISGAPGGHINEGSTVQLSVTGTDAGSADVSSLTYSWSVKKGGNAYTLPNGTVTNAANFSFSPNDNGAYVATVLITDKDGGTHSVSTGTINVDNVAPTVVVSGMPNGNINEGTAVTLTATPTDPGSVDTFTYSWSVTKGGNSFTLPNNAVTNQATFTFTPTDQGTYVATCQVTDNDGGVGSGNSGNIIALNAPPVVTIGGTPNGAVNEGATLNFTSSTSDPGANDTIATYAWSVLKDGNAFTLPNNDDTTSSTFSFVPTDNGTYVVSLSATDNDGGVGSKSTSSITVNNVAPTGSISGEPNGDINEGDTVNLSVSAGDVGSADVSSLTYSWSVKKDGAAYTLPNNAVTNGTSFTFIPRHAGAYVASVVVTDKDGGTVTVHSQTITADNVNPTATITGEPGSDINEGGSVTLTAHPSDAGADDTFTYAWSVKKDGNAYTLPNGTVTNTAGFTFSPNDNGDYIAKVVVTDDSGGSVSVNSQTITADNVAPGGTITGAPASSPEGTALTLTAHATDAGSADTFTYAWAVTKDNNSFTLPNNAVTNTPAFTFTPTDNGSYVATVTITDDDGGATPISTSAMTITNVAPTPTITGAPNNSVAEGSTISLGSTVTDPGSLDTVSYAWSVTKDGQPYTAPGNPAATTSSYSFIANDDGAYVVSLTATDNDGGHTTVTKNVSVFNVNPTIVINGAPGSAINEGDQVSLTTSVTDPGSLDTFTYAWSVKKGGVAYTLPNNVVTNASSFTFNPNDNGSYVATVEVDDNGGGAGITHTSAITVNNVAPTPTISGEPQQSINEGSTVNLAVAVTDPGSVDTFTYAWSVKKDGQPFTLGNSVATNGTTLSFVAPDQGSYVAKCVVTDKDGGANTATSQTITVVNVAPTATISGLPTNNTSPEGTEIDLSALASDPGVNDTISYDWNVTKNGNDFADGTNSSLHFTPDDDGSYVVNLTVSDGDGGSTIVSPQTIAVTDVAPTAHITGVPNSANEGAEIDLGSTVTDPSSADTNAGFTLNWTVKLQDQTVTTGTGSSFNFTPNDNGQYTVLLSATDKDTLVGTDSKTITVQNVKPSASITGAPDGSVPEGTAVTLGTQVTDPSTADTQAGFTYAWSVLKDGQAFTLPEKTSTSQASFTFTPTDNGQYQVKCTVSDKDGGSVNLSQNISVTNVAPSNATITGAPTTSPEGTAISMTGSATDPGSADTFTYAWTVKKGDATVTTGTGSAFNFTPADNGTYSVSLVVTDDDGGVAPTVSKTITVTNVAPTGTFTVGSTGVVGTTTNATVTIADPGSVDTETVTIDWGDGSAVDTLTSGASGTLSPTHVYQASGNFPVVTTITDDDGGSTAVNSTVTVKSFAVQTDPMDNTKTALVVGGTNGDDVISFTQNSIGRIKAVLDGVLLGTFAPTGHIIAYGGGGNNTITVDPSITTSAILYGGSGKDVLQGGSGDDVLIGRRGNDALFGGAGRDILIGGVGADSMDGGTGEDILMGGSTAGSESFNFLAAITAEWSRTDVIFANRVKQLKGSLAGGLNGSNKLNDGDVFEDANPDTMTGGSDSGDAFYTNTTPGSGEVITDLGKTDVVTNVVIGISAKPPVKKHH
jgi:RTX calcium-binding nonapeptide repeat (4 copies)/PKD domain